LSPCPPRIGSRALLRQCRWPPYALRAVQASGQASGRPCQRMPSTPAAKPRIACPGDFMSCDLW
jgi:hypothetical protein